MENSNKNPNLNLTVSLMTFLCLVAFLLIREFTFPKADIRQSEREKVSSYFDSDGELLELRFLDVGQGDSSLITVPQEDGGDIFILVDTGGEDGCSKLLKQLNDLKVKDISLLIITHPHYDHCANAERILDEFTVEKILTDGFSSLSDSLKEAIEKEGAEILSSEVSALTFGGLTLTFTADDTAEDINDGSIVIRGEYGSASFLLMGDAGKEREEALISSGITVDSDILKLGHHGASNASGEEFIKAVSPSYGVISCGKDNEFGHPSREVLDTLDRQKVTPLRTDLLGRISFFTDGKALHYITEK